MLGSVHDADDAVQDALLRAWRGLPAFEGRSSLRSWLYKIATRTALDVAQRRAKRELPAHYGPPARPGAVPGAVLVEHVWVEPYPDHEFVEAGKASPEALYEQRESLELAFVAALQYLPPLQRSTLILRDVLGFAAQEVAAQLGTSVQAVNSALQRARASTSRRVPAQSQQATLRSLGDEGLRQLVERYVGALERGDAETLVGMLTKDAAWAMPPLATWYQGRDAIRDFLVNYGFQERWRHLPTRANGQLALGCYTLDADKGCCVASALAVLRLEGDQVAEVDYFITSELLRRWGNDDGGLVGSEAFPRFGLPAELA
jgi:RNA polymerase sigma-70 factor (ECF subfamily)